MGGTITGKPFVFSAGQSDQSNSNRMILRAAFAHIPAHQDVAHFFVDGDAIADIAFRSMVHQPHTSAPRSAADAATLLAPKARIIERPLP